MSAFLDKVANPNLARYALGVATIAVVLAVGSLTVGIFAISQRAENNSRIIGDFLDLRTTNCARSADLAVKFNGLSDNYRKALRESAQNRLTSPDRDTRELGARQLVQARTLTHVELPNCKPIPR